MNAANRKGNIRQGRMSKPRSETQDAPTIVRVRDAERTNIRCVYDRKKGIRYINELATRDAVTILMD